MQEEQYVDGTKMRVESKQSTRLYGRRLWKKEQG